MEAGLSTMIFVFVTCVDEAEAARIAEMVVEQKLAACAHIMPPHRSVYRWQGKVEQAAEVNLLIKTRADLFEDVRSAVAAAHSYDVPCIVSWPVTDAHAPFLDWVQAETRD
ncbi:MAG: divalent-cation tolerance protein CutA [Alphaproteobacteria bacterium]|nr:divalent-cation tolerance protein CutA [Alphaproteobacteria bacterium]